MIVAKYTALTGLTLFLAGAAGPGGTAGIAAGCILLLVGATVGAVVLEGRDVEPAAGLLYGIDGVDAEPAIGVSQVVELPTAA